MTIFRSLDELPDGFCHIDGQEMYRIGDVDRMAPFLMSIVSDTDLWMFLSSTGGLTAGRVDEDRAIFPYVTDDQLHKCHRVTGPFTLLRISRHGEKPVLWEPFAATVSPQPIRRNLFKNALGNRVIFEEIHRELGLRFRYRWSHSDTYGIVRSCALENDGGDEVRVDVLDGLLNILPAGVELMTQQRASCLVNAYTQCETDEQTGIGIFSMTSLLTDKAEPAEALKANVVWSCGLDEPTVLLSTDQLHAFARGDELHSETILKGRRGAYLVSDRLTLRAGQSKSWAIVADASLDQPALESVRADVLSRHTIESKLEQSIQQGSANLLKNLASADGLQISGDRMAASHHLANALFNNMRGGVFAHNSDVSCDDVRRFVQQRNHPVAKAHAAFFGALPNRLPIDQLLHLAKEQGDADLLRLCYEYLPITFSRRHGDPSRPWNRFAIHVKDSNGEQLLSYQGNWRDIFQNWESMCASFPAFLESVIAKFVNASTIDGFNPYRVTRAGIDWESPDPHDPWVNIGYWGDHQVIYLLRLLELSQRFHPDELKRLLTAKIFSYANVPYRIKPYQQILVDRWNTIDFDRALENQIKQRVDQIGSDGKLVMSRDGGILHVTLLEKMLVTFLSKCSNLVVDGGIWMNTQRPEWNDANNALVGNGISMVTHCYLRRFTTFLLDLLPQVGATSTHVSREVVQWFNDISAVLGKYESLLKQATISDRDRKRVLDDLGEAFSTYRGGVYQSGLSDAVELKLEEITATLELAQRYLDHGIRANRRNDGLYHAYNLISFSDSQQEAHVDHLYEMLEGQVAVLSSGVLGAQESSELIEAMFKSQLFRQDQRSFMLYPDRELPLFLDRNQVPAGDVEANALLSSLIATGDRSIISRDSAGCYRFSSAFRNAGALGSALDQLAKNNGRAVNVGDHRESVLKLFEKVFNHRAFTGRSGTMYGYEGLGCIYWHMVSKLLLAVQECYLKAARDGDDSAAATLAHLYYRVREGLGFNKSAQLYGAFPMDPYSHTPRHAGAQQPGMTGQVKEEILTRTGELGVRIENGMITFQPSLLRRREFLTREQEWSYFDINGNEQSLHLPTGSLAFTVCQTPVIYHLTSGDAKTTVHWTNGKTVVLPQHQLDQQVSAAIFERDGAIARIEVSVPESSIELK
jgi:hypothetical protein